MLQKKTELFNFIILAYFFSKKMIEIHIYCHWYKNSKGLAITHDFTAHWTIKIMQMVYFWKFNHFKSQVVLIYTSGLDWNCLKIAICLFFIAQRAIKFQVIAILQLLAIIQDFTAHWAIKKLANCENLEIWVNLWIEYLSILHSKGIQFSIVHQFHIF